MWRHRVPAIKAIHFFRLSWCGLTTCRRHSCDGLRMGASSGSDRSRVSSKTCTVCEQTKPVSEFYRRSDKKDHRMSHCKVCDAARRRNNGQEAASLRRSRAYSRAVRALIDAHPEEFKRLQVKARKQVDEEADRLAVDAGLPAGEEVLLRSGPAGRDETTIDRVAGATRGGGER